MHRYPVEHGLDSPHKDLAAWTPGSVGAADCRPEAWGWLLTEDVDTITVNVEAAVGPDAVALWQRGRVAMRVRRRTRAHTAQRGLR